MIVASPEDRKELFKRYQLKMKELKGSSKSKSSAPLNHMKVLYNYNYDVFIVQLCIFLSFKLAE
jgi:hypothetical protein